MSRASSSIGTCGGRKFPSTVTGTTARPATESATTYLGCECATAPTSGRRSRIARWMCSSLGGSSPAPIRRPVRRSTATTSFAVSDERLALRELIHMTFGSPASRIATWPLFCMTPERLSIRMLRAIRSP
jgi:hypothetical protein